MKSIRLALASILTTTASAWATPAPLTLTYIQLVDIVQHADADLSTIPGFVGAHLTLDLRPSAIHPYFIASGHAHGLTFICQTGFETFAGGPVTATVIRFERGEDARDYVKLDACTALER